MCLDVANLFSLNDAIERRLSDINMSACHQISHMAEQERQQQRSNVTAVDVGVSHYDDLAIAALGDIHLIFAASR